MIYAKNIKDLNHIKNILDNIKNNIAYWEEMHENVPEGLLEDINFQLCEIEEFIIGRQKYTVTNIFKSDLRMMKYWKYIDSKCSFWDLIKELKENEGDI